MFETVVPEASTPRSRKLFYGTLPVSLALHGLAAAAIATMHLWDVTFPKHSPTMYAQ